MVVAQFKLRRVGVQSNNRLAYAQIVTSNGALLNSAVQTTTSATYNDNGFTLIAYDYANNTSTRTYYLQVKRGHVSDNLEIKDAAIWAIEFTP